MVLLLLTKLYCSSVYLDLVALFLVPMIKELFFSTYYVKKKKIKCFGAVLLIFQKVSEGLEVHSIDSY